MKSTLLRLAFVLSFCCLLVTPAIKAQVPPTITGIQPPAPLNIPNQCLVLIGKDFQDKLTITFEDGQGKAVDLPADQVAYMSPTKVVATATLATSGKWKVRATNPAGKPSADYEFAVALYPAIDDNSPSVKHYAKVSQAITILLYGLLLLIVIVLVVYMAMGKWSLASALSEESSYQPAVIKSEDGKNKNNVVMVASTSRLIALLGLLGILTTVLGIGYAIIWNLFVYGTVPPLTQIRSFLFGAACLFAPYLANQIRAAFEPSAAPTPPANVKQATPPETVITGVSPSGILVNSNPQQIQITGTGFKKSPAVVLTDPSGTATTLTNAQILSIEPTLITVNAMLGTAGSWKVAVTNPGANSSNAQEFTVTGKPVIQTHEPKVVKANAAAPTALTLLGTGFKNGLEVALTNPTGNVTKLAQGNFDVKADSVQIRATLTAGDWKVVITNPGPNNSDIYTFTVAAP